MSHRDLALSAQSQHDIEGFHALSVFSAAGKTADDIAIGVPLAHSMIRVSTVGRLRDAGYDVVSSPGPPGHADLVFSRPPSDDDWRRLDECFDPARPNPATMGGGDA